MARVKVNMSALVRQAIEKLGIDIPASDLIAEVRKTHGKDVTANLINAIKQRLRSKQGGTRSVRGRRKAKAATRNGSLSLADLQKGVEVFRQLGGVERAYRIAKALREIMGERI